MAPAGRIDLEVVNYDDIPIYNGDLEAKGLPDSVKRIAAKINEADGVLFASPEYNHSISGALKNLVDWISRVNPIPLNFKAVGIVSAAGGPGGMRS